MSVETLEVPTATAGGVLAVEAASGGGRAVLLHAGSPGSRVMDPTFVEQAAGCGFRLLSYDRPGYGRSSPRPGRRVAEAAADAALIADSLGLDRIAIWGFSGGGPFALACAALIPTRVSATCVFASIAPWQPDRGSLAVEVSPSYQEEIELSRADPVAYRMRFQEDAAATFSELSQAESWLERWGRDAGTDAAHSRELAMHLAANSREAARQGDEGWWEDWVAYHQAWGFELADIQGPMQLWHGDRDIAVPIGHGRWLARQIPHAQTHIVPDDDHATIEIGHRAEALRWLTEQV